MPASTDLLDFLRRLLADGVPPVDGYPTVVAAGVSSIERHRPVIEQVMRHAEGVALFATDFVEGTQGELDSTVKQLLESRLAVGRGSRPQLSLSELEGQVTATFAGQEPGGELGGGDREILGLATMLFSKQVPGTSVAMFAYNEDALDAQMRPLVWRFFTEDLPTVHFATSRIILIVETSQIDLVTHCPEGNGLVLYLDDSGLRSRQGWEASEPLIRAIAQSIRNPQRDIVFFLGAGFSSSSEIPLGDQLRNRALQGLVGGSSSAEIVREEDLVLRFENYIRGRGRQLPDEAGTQEDHRFAESLTLERVMREELSLHPIEQSPTLDYFDGLNTRALARLGRSVTALRELALERPRARIAVITVNFDTLLEDSGDAFDVYTSPDDFEGFPDKFAAYLEHPFDSRVPLLKLHGAITDRASINMSVEDTSSLLQAKAAALRAISANMSNPWWVYVGYSMRDLDITDLLRLDEFGSRIREWWVSPFVNEVCRRFGQRRWTADPTRFNQRTIDVSSDTFFSVLLRLVHETA